MVTEVEGNATEVEEATPPVEETEAAAAEVTEAASASETTEEAPDISAMLAGLDEDSLQELEPVKGLIARREESVRQRTEAQAARDRRVAEQEWLQRGTYETDLREIASLQGEGDDRSIAFDSEKLQSFVGRIMSASQDLGREELSGVINQRLNGVQVPYERIDQLQGLADQVRAGQASRDDFTNAQLDLVRDIEAESLATEKFEAWKKDFISEQEQRTQVEQRRQTDQDRRDNDSATRGIEGSSGQMFTTQREVEAAHAHDELPTSEYAAMRRDGRFDALPR